MDKSDKTDKISITGNKLFLLIFFVVWGLLTVWNILTPVKEFSEAENRVLQSFPKFSVNTLLSGKYIDNVNTFLNDQFVGREYWVIGQTLMEYGLGKREVNEVYLGKNALLGHMLPANMAMTEANINGINAFAERYEIPTYVIIIPIATSVQREKMPVFAQSWDEESYIAHANDLFSDKVTPVPVYDVMREHREEYIYYRTDHHWTTYGAYLAYNQLALVMSFPERQQEDFEISTVSDQFYGTHHSKTGFPLVSPDNIEVYSAGRVTDYKVFDGAKEIRYDSIYFEDYLNKKDKYSYFLGQIQPYVTVYTASDSGKKLIIFKDSYAHCMIPMLLDDYSEIRLVDLRFIDKFDFNKILNISDYDEALFLYNTDVFSHQIGAGKLLYDES